MKTTRIGHRDDKTACRDSPEQWTVLEMCDRRDVGGILGKKRKGPSERGNWRWAEISSGVRTFCSGRRPANFSILLCPDLVVLFFSSFFFFPLLEALAACSLRGASVTAYNWPSRRRLASAWVSLPPRVIVSPIKCRRNSRGLANRGPCQNAVGHAGLPVLPRRRGAGLCSPQRAGGALARRLLSSEDVCSHRQSFVHELPAAACRAVLLLHAA